MTLGEPDRSTSNERVGRGEDSRGIDPPPSSAPTSPEQEIEFAELKTPVDGIEAGTSWFRRAAAQAEREIKAEILEDIERYNSEHQLAPLKEVEFFVRNYAISTTNPRAENGERVQSDLSLVPLLVLEIRSERGWIGAAVDDLEIFQSPVFLHIEPNVEGQATCAYLRYSEEAYREALRKLVSDEAKATQDRAYDLEDEIENAIEEVVETLELTESVTSREEDITAEIFSVRARADEEFLVQSNYGEFSVAFERAANGAIFATAFPANALGELLAGYNETFCSGGERSPASGYERRMLKDFQSAVKKNLERAIQRAGYDQPIDVTFYQPQLTVSREGGELVAKFSVATCVRDSAGRSFVGFDEPGYETTEAPVFIACRSDGRGGNELTMSTLHSEASFREMVDHLKQLLEESEGESWSWLDRTLAHRVSCAARGGAPLKLVEVNEDATRASYSDGGERWEIAFEHKKDGTIRFHDPVVRRESTLSEGLQERGWRFVRWLRGAGERLLFSK